MDGVIINREKQEYHVMSEAGSLGDLISATAIFKNGRAGSITINDGERHRNWASIFNGLGCEVKFQTPIPYPMPLKGTGPVSKRILNALEIEDYGLPCVIPDPIEVEKAKKFLADNNVVSPVVICGMPGGVSSLDKPLVHNRKPPRRIMERLVENIQKAGETPITFGLSSNLELYPGVLSIPDLTIKQLTAYYSVIGRYIGADTADYHLSLAVNGTALVLIPDHSIAYNYNLHLYTEDCFPDGLARVQYINFNQLHA